MTFALGIVAALAAPFTMSVGFIVWDNHWAGSAFALNMFKCNLASIGFVVLSAATRPEHPFSSDVFEVRSVGYLMLSSVIGIVVGDWTWLEGLRLLGPRRVIVMDSLKPFLAAVFGWVFLDEELRLGALGGIVLTVVGILLVSLESEQTEEDREEIPKKNEIVDGEETNALENKARVEATTTMALGDPSTLSLSLATGSFPQSTIAPSVVVDEKNADTTVAESDGDLSTSQPKNSKDNEASPSSESFPPPQIDNEGQTYSSHQKQAPPRTNSFKRASTRLETQRGFAMAILNVVLDTYGSVLTKEHGSKFSTWEINLVRFGFAGVVMIVCSILLQVRDYIQPNDDKKDPGGNELPPPGTTADRDEERGTGAVDTSTADVSTSTSPTPHAEDAAWYKLPLDTMTRSSWLHVCLGVLFVTFVTPALSNYALFQIALALALTLGSVGPLYALPLTFVMQKDQKLPTLRVCLGAALAVAGIVVLAFWGTLK